MHALFETTIERQADGALAGPWRSPQNMLSAQSYDGHRSIHDDDTASKLGFQGGTVEGPTHFSQLAPLGVAIWGEGFLAWGCISAHYRTPCYDGEETQAFAHPTDDGRSAHIQIVKRDGSEVLRGTMSVGPAHAATALDQRLAELQPLEQRRILADIVIGATTPRRRVTMGFDQNMGALYPFSLKDKLGRITEPSPAYDPATALDTPWGRAILPFEMVSVLGQYTVADEPIPVRNPVVGLFADQEIRLIDGPLLVGEPYELERTFIAISGSRRTESLWIRTSVFRAGSDHVVATLLLNQAYLKASSPSYPEHQEAVS
ncbi:hypothetical protein [Phenylobacterium sp.]|uniref:hypothetical protein n=1 Tax=Phenylobacterium sp. TaxID=1871053 RepID=UPI003D29729B